MFLLYNLLSHLLRHGTAVEAHIVEGGVIKAILVFLHLALNATDSTVDALLAPVAILPPLRTGPLQRRVAAAAELDVVHGRVVTEQTLMGLHTNLEGGEHACGAVHGMGPLTEAGRESEGKKKKIWKRSTDGRTGTTSRYFKI